TPGGKVSDVGGDPNAAEVTERRARQTSTAFPRKTVTLRALRRGAAAVGDRPGACRREATRGPSEAGGPSEPCRRAPPEPIDAECRASVSGSRRWSVFRARRRRVGGSEGRAGWRRCALWSAWW